MAAFDTQEERWTRRQAVFLAVFACALFACGMGALVKAIDLTESGPELHPFQIVHARFLFGFLVICALLLVLQRSGGFRSRRPFLHALRAFCGVGGLSLWVVAITQMPLADVTAIVFANPLFVLIFCVLALRENVGLRRWTAVAVGFCGVLVIAQPSSNLIQPAVFFALCAAMLMGIDIGLIRLLARYDHPLTALAINNGLCALLSGLLAVFVWKSPSFEQWLLLISIGLTVVVGQIALLRAITISQASFVAPYLYCTLVFGAFYGYVFFAEVPGFSSLAGAALIIGAGLYLGLEKTNQSARQAPATYAPSRLPAAPQAAGRKTGRP